MVLRDDCPTAVLDTLADLQFGFIDGNSFDPYQDVAGVDGLAFAGEKLFDFSAFG